MKQFLFFLLLNSCVSREKYAAALRDAELAQGRLSDQQKISAQQLAEANNNNNTLQQEKKIAEQRASTAEASLQKSLEESANRGLRIQSLEQMLSLWRSLPSGQFEDTAFDPSAKSASAVTLRSVDPETKKPNWTLSKTGLALTPEANAQIKQWAASIQNTKHTLWLLGFGDFSTDIKTSGEYALLVARAFIANGISPARIKMSAMGFAGPLCQDPPLGLPEDPLCSAKNNRVQIILLSEGF